MRTRDVVVYSIAGLSFVGIIAVFGAAEQGEKVEQTAAIVSGCKADDPAPAIMSKHFVKPHLRAPSTAEFPWTPLEQRYLGDCTWQVLSYVDAQNGFGGTVRTPYLITMVYHPASQKWLGHDLQM